MFPIAIRVYIGFILTVVSSVVAYYGLSTPEIL